MSEAKHSPLPWELIEVVHSCLPRYIVVGKNQPPHKQVCELGNNANAEFIVLACNSHDDLLKACEAMVHAARLNDPALGGVAATLAECAIAKSTGVQSEAAP